MKIELVYGNEIPPKFEYLRGGVFINALPKKVESEDSDLYSYYQTFTMETNEERLEKVAKTLLIQIANQYLASTGWYVERLNDPSSGKAIPEDVVLKRAEARELINILEAELGV